MSKPKPDERNRQRGSDRWSAKLGEAEVRFIRASSDKNAALAAQFGVTTGAIEHVKRRRTWRHLV